MSTQLSGVSIAEEVREGLGRAGQKQLPSSLFYDALGSTLFEAITLLPEYGLTRADERLLKRHAREIASAMPRHSPVAELGSGSGKKTRWLLEALEARTYYPIDVSGAALESCAAQLAPVTKVRPVESEYLPGLCGVADYRRPGEQLLVLFLGSTIGNFDRRHAREFLTNVRECLKPGDALLIGADLVKNVDVMLAAYDDPTGVTAAFNRNILGRLNRELGANFDLASFHHEARWNEHERRIEMHLVSAMPQRIRIPGAGLDVRLEAGETIWTESSHKYTPDALAELASGAGFTPEAVWTDREWPFAECLWRVPTAVDR